MSFHAGQTFTFGEQPSATKWQYLWDNDYALADGSGISNDAIINRHIGDQAVDGLQMKDGSILWADSGTDITGDVTFADITNWYTIDINGTSGASFTTQKNNQKVVMISRFQRYRGGNSAYRFTVDGNACIGAGAASANALKIGDADAQQTTSAVLVVDFATIATAGAHALRIQAKADDNTNRLRYIHTEGAGQLVAFAIH